MKSKTEELFTAFLVAAISGIVKVLLGGLFFMWIVDVIHTTWILDFPTIGYWHACVLSLMLSALVGVLTWEKSE